MTASVCFHASARSHRRIPSPELSAKSPVNGWQRRPAFDRRRDLHVAAYRRKSSRHAATAFRAAHLMVPKFWQRRPAYASGLSAAICPNGPNGVGDLPLHFRMATKLLRRCHGACKSTAAAQSSPRDIVAWIVSNKPRFISQPPSARHAIYPKAPSQSIRAHKFPPIPLANARLWRLSDAARHRPLKINCAGLEVAPEPKVEK